MKINTYAATVLATGVFALFAVIALPAQTFAYSYYANNDPWCGNHLCDDWVNGGFYGGYNMYDYDYGYGYGDYYYEPVTYSYPQYYYEYPTYYTQPTYTYYYTQPTTRQYTTTYTLPGSYYGRTPGQDFRWGSGEAYRDIRVGESWWNI